MIRDRFDHRPPNREVASLSGDEENDHHHEKRNDDLEVSLESEPVLLPIDGMCALCADDTHPKVNLNRVHATPNVASALVTAGLDPTPEVILGVHNRTPAAVAVGHGQIVLRLGSRINSRHNRATVGHFAPSID